MRKLVVIAAILAAVASVPHAAAGPISAAFDRVKESVVVIRTTGVDLPPGGSRELVTVGGLGSGVLVDRDGIILTAAHVVQTAETIEVEFADGEVVPGKVYSSEPNADIAVVKLERPPTGGVVAKLGDSDKVTVGEEIFIVGAPLGISYTLTVGHISARRQANSVWGGLSQADLFQTDAAITTGNSGGPMFNLDGEVVGIVSSMISRTGGYEGLGFVVTSNMARVLVLEQRPFWSGLDGFALTGELAQIFNLPQPMGILVQRVTKSSPAARLGLQPGTLRATIEGEPLILGGDIILAVGGIAVSDQGADDRIRKLISTLTPGDNLNVTVLRHGERVELNAVAITP
jgi:S1-C subfamily serine protease